LARTKKKKVILEEIKEAKEVKTIVTEKITPDDYIQDLDEIKVFKVKINYVEENSLVVNLHGWAKRINFELSFNDLDYIRQNKKSYSNKYLTIWYVGDILNPFTVNILPIKSLNDIGDGHY
jgi:hypothetical protein